MRVWIVCFIVVFATAEFCQWVKDYSVPLPVFMLAGAILAIASNYGKYTGWSFQQHKQAASQGQSLSGVKSASWATLNPSTTTAVPKLNRPISFIINRHTQKEE